MAQKRMTAEEIQTWILRKLGGPIVCVELDAEMLETAVDDAIEWFIAKKGIETYTVLTATPGETNLAMPDDFDTVLDVIFTERELDFATIFSPFAFVDKIPYDVFANPRGGGLYSSFTQSLQYIETAKRIISVEPEWQVVRGQDKYMLVYRLAADAFGAGNLNVVVFYKPNCIRVEELVYRDHEMLRRYALAVAKEMLAQVRGKYDSYPTAQGTLSLNADRLLEQSQTEKDKLEEEIFDSAFPMPFITG